MKLLDIVILCADLPKFGLVKGQQGTIVEILSNGEVFEVDFSDNNGRTIESVTLTRQQIMKR